MPRCHVQTGSIPPTSRGPAREWRRHRPSRTGSASGAGADPDRRWLARVSRGAAPGGGEIWDSGAHLVPPPCQSGQPWSAPLCRVVSAVPLPWGRASGRASGRLMDGRCKRRGQGQGEGGTDIAYRCGYLSINSIRAGGASKKAKVFETSRWMPTGACIDALS